MTTRRPPRLALALLDRFAPDRAALAGDLVEEFGRRRSRVWFWWQVLAAIATAHAERPVEIRPLRLVDLQPVDALERSRKLNLRFRPVNLSASPVPGIGGLGLVVLALLMSTVAPGAWGWLLASAVAGGVVGIAVGVFRRKRSAR